MEYKHSAVDLTDLAIGIVVLGIVVSIGSTILLGVRNTTYQDSTLLTTVNETVGNLTSPKTLDNVWVNTLTRCHDSGTGLIVTANTSLSVNAETGVGTITGTGTASSKIVNCTYSYYDVANNPAYTTADNASVGLGEYANWFDIIIIVGIAAVILSLIFMAFGRGSLGGGY
jgi:hypothetical protein